MGSAVAVRGRAVINIKVEGLDELRATLAGFSDRRFNAAVATGLTRTGVLVRESIKTTMRRVFDRPTPYTMNALFLEKADATRLVAKVWLKDDRAGSGTPATEYLLPQVSGGARNVKRFEVGLRAIGALPAGWLVTPGAGARLDAYGNVSKGQIIEVLSQLRITLLAGSTRNMSFDARRQIRAQRRAGGRFFVVAPGGRLQPGVYQREFFGRNVTPVFAFVSRASYRKRLDFYGEASKVIEANLQAEIGRGIAEQIERLAQKTARPA